MFSVGKIKWLVVVVVVVVVVESEVKAEQINSCHMTSS